MALVLATVAGRFIGYDEAPTVGKVTFTPIGWRALPDVDLVNAPVPIEVPLASDGSFTVNLDAPADINEDVVVYHVDVELTRAGTTITDAFDITMPVCAVGSYLNLADRDLDTGQMVITASPAPPPVLPTDGGTGVVDVWS